MNLKWNTILFIKCRWHCDRPIDMTQITAWSEPTSRFVHILRAQTKQNPMCHTVWWNARTFRFVQCEFGKSVQRKTIRNTNVWQQTQITMENTESNTSGQLVCKRFGEFPKKRNNWREKVCEKTLGISLSFRFHCFFCFGFALISRQWTV